MAGARSSFEKFLAACRRRDRYRADAYNRLGDSAIPTANSREAGGSMTKPLRWRRPNASTPVQTGRDARHPGPHGPKLQALRQIVTAGQGDYVDAASYELGRSYIRAGTLCRRCRTIGTVHCRLSLVAAP